MKEIKIFSLNYEDDNFEEPYGGTVVWASILENPVDTPTTDRAHVLEKAIDKYLNQLNQLRFDFDGLQSRVAELEQRIISGSVNIIVQNLPLDKIELKKQIALLMENKDGKVVVSSYDLDMFGVGETEYDAIKDFAESIEEMYFELREEKDSLSNHLKNVLNYMETIIEERDG